MSKAIDPLNGEEFESLSDEELEAIMAAYARLEDRDERKQEAVKYATTMAEQVYKDSGAAQELDEFKEKHLAHIRATVHYNRINYNQAQTVTKTHLLECVIPKQKNMQYDKESQDLIQWAKINIPEALKPQELKKAVLDRYLKSLKTRDLPTGVTAVSRETKVRIRRLK